MTRARRHLVLDHVRGRRGGRRPGPVAVLRGGARGRRAEVEEVGEAPERALLAAVAERHAAFEEASLRGRAAVARPRGADAEAAIAAAEAGGPGAGRGARARRCGRRRRAAPGGRGRAAGPAGPGAQPQRRRGLPHLPAALPVRGGRPGAGAAEPGAGGRGRRSRRARGPLPARRDRRRRRGAGAAVRRRRCAARGSAGDRRGPPGAGPRPARPCRAYHERLVRSGAGRWRWSASSRSRSARTGCTGASTAWTPTRPAATSSWTTRPASRRRPARAATTTTWCCGSTCSARARRGASSRAGRRWSTCSTATRAACTRRPPTRGDRPGQVREAAEGIAAGRFEPRPSWACRTVRLRPPLPGAGPMTLLSALEPGGPLEGVYAVRRKERRLSRQGRPFLALTLADASGAVPAVVFDEPDYFARPVRGGRPGAGDRPGHRARRPPRGWW